MDTISVDYSATYEDYWNRSDRIGSASFHDPEVFVREIILTCGRGKLLDVGCGEGGLVLTLLRHSVDAFGVDCSATVIERCRHRAPGRFQQASIVKLPFADESFDTLVSTDVLEHIAPQDVPTALQELFRVTRRNVFLKICPRVDRDGIWHLTIAARRWWEEQCLAAGFRLHPREMNLTPLVFKNYTADPETIILEKPPYPTSFASPSSDCLHETTYSAVALRAQYAAAASHIRRNGVVLDIAQDCGAGAYILYRNSLASSVTAIVPSAFQTYAEEAYGKEDTITFKAGGLEQLAEFPDNSVDYIVALDLFDRSPCPLPWLREAQRIVRPAGRIFMGSGGGGKRKNSTEGSSEPWNQLLEYSSSFFLPEKGSCLKGGITDDLSDWLDWVDLPALSPIGNLPFAASRFFLLAMKNPMEGKTVPYVERLHHPPLDWPFYDFSFSESYENPWLVYGLFDRADRIGNYAILDDLIGQVLSSHPEGSAEKGAALCVRAYCLLQHEEKGSCTARHTAVYALIKAMEHWIEMAPAVPISTRWRVSLFHVGGELLLSIGDFARAEVFFLSCANNDIVEFCPTLGTRIITAYHHAALLALSRNDIQAASKTLATALTRMWNILSAANGVMGDIRQPLRWSLLDMRKIMEAGEKCLALLSQIHTALYRPGIEEGSEEGLRQLLSWENAIPALQRGFEAGVKQIEGKEVYFWGYGDTYRRRKAYFRLCKPRCILADSPGLHPNHIDGLPILHPKDVLSKNDKLPIVLFVNDSQKVLETLARDFPQYSHEDIIFCNVPFLREGFDV